MERVPCLQSPSLMLRSRENKCKVRIINGSFYPCASRMPVVSLASISNIRVSNNTDRQIIIKSSNLSTLDPILKKDATHFQKAGSLDGKDRCTNSNDDVGGRPGKI